MYPSQGTFSITPDAPCENPFFHGVGIPYFWPYRPALRDCVSRLVEWIYRSMPGIVRQFVNHVVPGVVKPLRVLWNEVVGFFFFVFGIWFGGSAFREFRHLNQTPDGMGRLIITTVGAAIMLGYGIHSFLRARKIDRS